MMIVEMLMIKTVEMMKMKVMRKMVKMKLTVVMLLMLLRDADSPLHPSPSRGQRLKMGHTG